MLHGPYGEQYQPYNRCQGHYHKPVSPSVLQTEEVGEAYRRYPPEDQYGPKHSWDTLLGCDQTHSPCVGQYLDLVKSFRVELLVGRGAWLEILEVCADIVYKGPPGWSSFLRGHQGCLSLLHQRVLLVDHLLGVGSGEFLEEGTFWLREPMGKPEDLGHSVGLLLDRLACRVVFPPHGDDHERKQHSVDHAQGCVDEACNVVVGPARVNGHKALH